MIGLSNKKVILVEHTEQWNEEYRKEAWKLKELLGDLIVCIEHVGSTAIPHIHAKPLIDIAVGVASEQKFKEIKKKLIDAGYDFCNHAGDTDRLFFAKGEEGCRTHNIHIEIYEGRSWKNHVEFRDYLIEHPEYAIEYCNLKKQLAEKYENERKKYTKEKDNYIKSILQKCEH